ncbi:MAG: ERF family protein [candidate division WOR-3 bacterium]|nr:ERF family protein [candidate division WOR-3 bacterium]
MEKKESKTKNTSFQHSSVSIQLTIDQKLSAIQRELKVAKTRKNKFGNYNYRSAEDILEALKPFNEKYEVYFTTTEKYLADGVIQSEATIHDAVNAGESITAVAIVAVDFDQKGMQMPQRFGATSSYGKKYSFGNLLMIDDTADADATNDHADTRVVLQPNSVEFEKAKKFVADGGDLTRIELKYKLSPALKKQLAMATKTQIL